VLEGEERVTVWTRMVELYPPYADYQEATERRIPVILLLPTERVDTL